MLDIVIDAGEVELRLSTDKPNGYVIQRRSKGKKTWQPHAYTGSDLGTTLSRLQEQHTLESATATTLEELLQALRESHAVIAGSVAKAAAQGRTL
jgi:hypothetical protein